MRIKPVGKIVIMASLIIVILLSTKYPYLMISPGVPIEAHAHLSKTCFVCHTAFWGTPPEKCITCHMIEDIGKRTTDGQSISGEEKNVAFHQTLIEGNCVSCHSDHKGVKAFRPISQFSHDLLNSELRQQCDGCHNSPGDALHLNLKGNCSQCHIAMSWSFATFDHDKFFLFDRYHTNECITCHANHDYNLYTCYGCHEHSRSGIRKEHLEEGIRKYDSCVSCHRSGDEDEAKKLWRSKRSEGVLQNGHERDHDSEMDDHD
jgi:hypothetical protein